MFLLSALALSFALHAASAGASPPQKRPLAPSDLAAIADLSEPELSPDGNWVVYTVSRHDLETDESNDDLWITSWDGTVSTRMTTSKKGEATPRFSPDSNRIAFLSDRDNADEISQIYLMNRTGGEAEAITEVTGEIEDLAWAPDGKKLVVVMKDPDPSAVSSSDPDKAKKKVPPIVLDRFQFKEDKVGYLDQRRAHLYLLDIATKKLEPITTGAYNETLPAWSPDGTRLAFASKRSKDLDRDDNWDLFLTDAKPKSTPRKLTNFVGADLSPEWESAPSWSPDGKTIAYLRAGPQELIYYAMHRLAVVPGGGGEEKYLSPSTDNNFYSPKYSPDGQFIYFLLEEDRSTVLARIPAAGGEVERVSPPGGSINAFDVGPNGRVIVLQQSPKLPAEVYAVEGGKLRPLSRQNDAYFEQLLLGTVEETSFPSKDGTEIHGFLIKPPGYSPKKKYPAILRIHGGPVSQFEREMRWDLHVLAAQGYVVIAVNPRGSSGRGEAYSKAIYADWGNKDGDDVLAAVDDAVKRGIADPARLGIGGWSYGGILTNYVIARDTRFKAAISGAGIANVVAGYGTDMYIREYEYELGKPWKNTDVWLRLSAPFLHADRIVTPTLFICGEKDFNVPLLNSEQMYQALRSLGVDTRLVIYPGEAHDIKKPSYVRDRLERYLGWYDKYLRGK